MMEKAIKQRLVGGLVLIAGAALFLPMLLDGSGSELVVPPMPEPPKVAGVDRLDPRLEADVKAAEQAVDDAQAGPVFHEVTPPAQPEVVEDTPPDESYALAQAPAQPASPAPAQTSVAEKAATSAVVAEKAAAVQAARVAAQKAEADRLAREKAEKERLARIEAERKAQEARKAAEATTKPAATTPVPVKPAANLPQAWVVQVASLSARDKADELVTRLRAKGYRATLVHQSGMWKVLVGPELRKEVADSIKQRLAADPELRLSGWVQAWKP